MWTIIIVHNIGVYHMKRNCHSKWGALWNHLIWLNICHISINEAHHLLSIVFCFCFCFFIIIHAHFKYVLEVFMFHLFSALIGNPRYMKKMCTCTLLHATWIIFKENNCTSFYQSQGRFTLETEDLWPLHFKHSHWWKRRSRSKFACFTLRWRDQRSIYVNARC